MVNFDKRELTQYEYMLYQNKNHMNDIAISFDDKKITYEELHEKIDEYTKRLYNFGVRSGDKVAICCFNTPESIYLLYALDRLGAIRIGLSPLNNKIKMEHDIIMTNPKLIITADVFYKNIKSISKTLNIPCAIYPLLNSSNNKVAKTCLEFLGNISNFSNNYNKFLNISPILNEEIDYSMLKNDTNVSDVMFTGGSSGTHKGVMLTENGINYVAEAMSEKYDKVEPGMIHLGNIPLGHMIYGRMIMHLALSHNLEYAATLKAMPKDFYSEIMRTKSNCAVGGPPHFTNAFIDCQNKSINKDLIKDSLPFLIYTTSGGEKFRDDYIQICNEALEYCNSTARIGDCLGATETTSAIISNPGNCSFGTIGTPLSCSEIKLINPQTHEEVKMGDTGILCVSGPTIMKGYYNDIKENNSTMMMDENGKMWCITGDRLYQNELGEYVYAGREKRNFVCGVDNVYPEEIEDLLIKLPEVKEILVTKLVDDEKQYKPKYRILLTSDNVNIKELEKKINSIILNNIGVYALPSIIEYIDEPLLRMDNTKINVNYYDQIDSLKDKNLSLKNKKQKH